jgi:hypothetical protein
MKFMQSFCRQESEFSYFIRVMFIVAISKNCSVDEAGCVDTKILTVVVPPCLSGAEFCGVCPTVLGKKPIPQGGQKTVLSRYFQRTKRRTTVADYGHMFVSISGTIRCTKYTQTEDKFCLLIPSRFIKCWFGVCKQKTCCEQLGGAAKGFF